MILNQSHYLLFCEASVEPWRDGEPTSSAWRFVLEDVAGGRRLAASDAEPSACRERLELLAVVRGLEAIDHPAQVTLVTKSRYIDRGLKRGLAEWRANDWRWERFGKLTPVRDDDLWRRVDRALQFHRLQCRLWRFDDAECWGADRSEAPRSARACTPFPSVGNVAQHKVQPRRKRLISAAKSRFEGARKRAAALSERLAPQEGMAVG